MDKFSEYNPKSLHVSKLSWLVTLKPFVLKMTLCGLLREFKNVFAGSPWDEVIRLSGCKINPHN